MHHIKTRKDENHRIILVGVEKAFDKSQQPFMKKILNKMEPYFNIIKDTCDKSVANIIHDSLKLSIFPKIRNMTRMPTGVAFIQHSIRSSS